MTVLFQSDFEDTAGQGTVVVPTGMAGWAYDTASWLVFEASLVSLTAVNGTRVCGRDANLDTGYYTTSGAISNQAVRHAAKWQSHATPQVIGHLLRRETPNKFYFVYPETDGSSLRVKVVKFEGGSTEIATSSYVLVCSVGDVVHHESKIVGTTIESRIWKNSESRPSTATVSVTDSTISTGYPGLIKIGATGYAAADQVVITDGAGGEDYFYPESSGPTSAITATAANSVGSLTSKSSPLSAVSATTANLTAAWTSSSGVNSSITATTDNTVAALTSTGSTGNGTFTSEVLRDNTGTIVASKALNHVSLYNDTTGALVVRKTGLSTNGSGIFTFTDAAITAGTTYRVDWEDVDGRRRMPRKAAT